MARIMGNTDCGDLPFRWCSCVFCDCEAGLTPAKFKLMHYHMIGHAKEQRRVRRIGGLSIHVLHLGQSPLQVDTLYMEIRVERLPLAVSLKDRSASRNNAALKFLWRNPL